MAVFIYKKSFPDEQDIIRGRLYDMAEAMYMDEPDSKLSALSNAQKLKDFFSDIVDIDLEIDGRRTPRLTDPVDLIQKYAYFRVLIESFEMSFRDIKITIDSDSEAIAHIAMTAVLDFQISGEGPSGDVVLLEVEMRKEEKLWRIRRLSSVPDQ